MGKSRPGNGGAYIFNDYTEGFASSVRSQQLLAKSLGKHNYSTPLKLELTDLDKYL